MRLHRPSLRPMLDHFTTTVSLTVRGLRCAARAMPENITPMHLHASVLCQSSRKQPAPLHTLQLGPAHELCCCTSLLSPDLTYRSNQVPGSSRILTALICSRTPQVRCLL